MLNDKAKSPSYDFHIWFCHQAMFSLCMVESVADEVTLQGVTSVGLKHALDFAYTGQVRSLIEMIHE